MRLCRRWSGQCNARRPVFFVVVASDSTGYKQESDHAAYDPRPDPALGLLWHERGCAPSEWRVMLGPFLPIEVAVAWCPERVWVPAGWRGWAGYLLAGARVWVPGRWDEAGIAWPRAVGFVASAATGTAYPQGRIPSPPPV